MLYAAAAVERAMKIQQVSVRALSGAITWLRAADILGLDPRSMRRWRARYEAGGPVALYETGAGCARRGARPRPSRCSASCGLYRERFAGWNVRHFYRFARREHAVTLSVPSWDRPEASLAMTENGVYVGYALEITQGPPSVGFK